MHPKTYRKGKGDFFPSVDGYAIDARIKAEEPYNCFCRTIQYQEIFLSICPSPA
jgi:hypothetical protein